jgi:hypothetical protein
MKVYFSKYRSHWVSPYTMLEKALFWLDWENIPYDTPWVEKWATRLEPISRGLEKFLDTVHPKITIVKIDYYDTWSMDYTLAHIIVPMLKQLQETKQGSPLVDPIDVPEHLRPTEEPNQQNGYTDNTIHERWKWVLDEMIWAFEQKIDDDAEDKFWDHSAVNKQDDLNTQIGQIKCDHDGLTAFNERKANGFRLFGKYYQGLWD